MLRGKRLTGKFHSTRWGIVSLVVLVALAVIGVTYAGTASTGKVKPGELSDPFSWAVSNDDGSVNPGEPPYWAIDPGDNGLDPCLPQTKGVELPAEGRYDKDVASTTATLVDLHNITVTLSDAYPSYHPTVFYGIENTGTIVGVINSIIIDEDTTTSAVFPDENAPELTVTVTGIEEGDEVQPGDEAIGGMDIHVEQAAAQGATYSVRVTILTTIWYEEDEGGSTGFWKKSGERRYGADIFNDAWLPEIDTESLWLVPDKNTDEDIDVDDMDAIFVARNWETEYDKFIAQYLATWLNVKAGRLHLENSHNITAQDPGPGNYLYELDDPESAKLSDIIDAIEGKYYPLPPPPTEAQFTIMQKVCEAVNNP